MIKELEALKEIDTKFSLNYLQVIEKLSSVIITGTNTNIIYRN